MNLIDTYLESEKVRIMENECPLLIPWVARLAGDRLNDAECPEDCEKCWTMEIPTGETEKPSGEAHRSSEREDTEGEI